MPTITCLQPDSPNGAFDKAVELLKQKLSDQAAAPDEIADNFVTVLELLDAVPVGRSTYAAARAAVLANFRAVAHEFIDGKNGMDVRHGAVKDLDFHGKKVLLNSWI